jgi:predicted DNA-binding antitoxin AbrB/MazE fold protein
MLESNQRETLMTVKAIYGDGVFKSNEKVDLKDKTEVELEFKSPRGAREMDPGDFVGFIKNAPEGIPIARDHDKYIYKK